MTLDIVAPGGSSQSTTCSTVVTVQPTENLPLFAASNVNSQSNANTNDPLWNTSYQIVGSAQNPDQYCTFTISGFNIFELDTNTGNTQNFLPSVTPDQVPPGGETSFTTDTIMKNWPWLNQTIYKRDGPTDDTFSYNGIMNVQDQFGNLYPQVLSAFMAAPITHPSTHLILIR